MGDRLRSSEWEAAMSLMPLLLIGGLLLGAGAGAAMAYFDVNGKFPVVNGVIGGGFVGFVGGLAASALMFGSTRKYDEPIIPRRRS